MNLYRKIVEAIRPKRTEAPNCIAIDTGSKDETVAAMLNGTTGKVTTLNIDAVNEAKSITKQMLELKLIEHALRDAQQQTYYAQSVQQMYNQNVLASVAQAGMSGTSQNALRAQAQNAAVYGVGMAKLVKGLGATISGHQATGVIVDDLTKVVMGTPHSLKDWYEKDPWLRPGMTDDQLDALNAIQREAIRMGKSMTESATYKDAGRYGAMNHGNRHEWEEDPQTHVTCCKNCGYKVTTMDVLNMDPSVQRTMKTSCAGTPEVRQTELAKLPVLR